MTLSRRQKIAGAIVVGVLVLVAFGLWCVNKRAELARLLPPWRDYRQPPEMIAEPVGPMDRWAACRPGHMSASSTGMGAGRQVLRTYPGSLMASDQSIVPNNVIGFHVRAEGGV